MIWLQEMLCSNLLERNFENGRYLNKESIDQQMFVTNNIIDYVKSIATV